MLGIRWPQKPPVGTQIDRSHPFAEGLGVWLPLNEGTGGIVTDNVSGLQLVATNFGTNNPWTAAPYGTAVKANVSNAAFQGTVSPQLQKQFASYPLTMALCFYPIGSLAGQPLLFGFCTSSGGPVYGYFETNTSSQIKVASNTNVATSSLVLSATQPTIVSTTITSSAISLYVNGVLSATGSGTNTPGLTSTSLLFAGCPVAARAANSDLYWAGAWTQYHDASFHAAIGSSPNAIYQLHKPKVSVFSFAGAFGFRPSTTSIYASNPAGTVITLTGTGTTWSSGSTTFTVAGVAGAAKSAQSVTSATSAAITVTTGLGSGTLTISDGVYTTPVTIAPTSMTTSPSSIYANNATGQTFTLTGNGTHWATGTTTFSISGVAGASITSQSISSTTTATVTVTTGTTTGTLTITDGFTTTTLAVAAPTFTVSPSSIYSGNPSNVTLTLTGTGTNWGAGHTFTLSGVPGVTAVSESVASTTSATIVVTTAAGTGPLTITDGYVSSTVGVLSPSIAISPSAIPARHAGTITLTLTGTATHWVSGTTTFSIAGVTGATLVSQSITSATAATLVVTTGSATGALTVSDAIYSSTTAVNATTLSLSPPSGLYSVPLSITATGSVGSLWTHENAATLFSTPGTFGDSISSIVVTSDTSATFTINPGSATGGLTITQAPNGVTTTYAINGVPGSLRVLNNWNIQTAANSVTVGQAIVSSSYFVTFNSPPPAAFNLLQGPGTNTWLAAISAGTAGYYSDFPTGKSKTTTNGFVYHVASTWSKTSGKYSVYVNGVMIVSGTASTNFSATAGAWWLGSSYNGAVDYQIANFAVWTGYELNATDILNLRNGKYLPWTLIGSASGVVQPPAIGWLLGAQTSGTPSTSDYGFIDVTGNGRNFTNISGTSTSATYAPALSFVPAIKISPYITKSGQLACFMAQTNQVISTPVTGTVSISKNSTTLTTSAPQAAWVGNQISIAADSSLTTYTITGGYGSTFTISPAYAASSNAINSAATFMSAYPAATITSVTQSPTISVQFGGVGPAHAISTWGPVWSPTSLQYPCAFWQLFCGPVQSLTITNPGSGYSSAPSASVSGGGGSGCTLGTPVVTGGVTSFTITNPGSGYSSAPTVSISAPSIAMTGTLTSGLTSCTGLSSTAGLTVGMTIIGSGNEPNTIASIVSATAITLAMPSAVSGPHSLTIIGRNALATATISGGSVTAISVFWPGSGYLAASPPQVTLSGNATATATVTNVIASIPVTAGGSGYISQPTITISDSTGSGAVANTIMGGVSPADVVTYAAANEGWVQTATGNAPAAPSMYAGTSVANYSGQLEPGYGGFQGFTLPSNQRTLEVGFNFSAPFATPSSPFFPYKNWMKHTAGCSNVSSFGYDRRPLTISGTASLPCTLGFAIPTPTSGADGKGFPVPEGVWTFVTDDTNGNAPLSVSLTSGNAAAAVSAPTFTEGALKTGVNSITLGSPGSGYGDYPTVTISGGGGTGATAFALVSNGAVIQISLLCVGSGYTAPPTVTITDPAGTGSGATATVTIGPVLVGRTWQWTVSQKGNQNNLDLFLNFWSTAGGTYPYTMTNEFLFDPGSTAAAAPSIPARVSTAMTNGLTTNMLTSPSLKNPSVLRFMDSTMGDGGTCNIVEAEDLKCQYGWNWYEIPPGFLTSAQLAAAPTKSRTVAVTTIRTYALSTTCLGAITVAASGSNYSGTLSLIFGGVGGALGAAATATVSPGVVTNTSISAGGSGYTTVPTVTFAAPASGVTATGTATITGGVVTGITITNGGSGYTSNPALTISGGGGTAATASATIASGVITSVTVTAGGTGYTSAPTVSIYSATLGNNASFAATVSGGAVTGVTVTNGGLGYTSFVPVVITDPAGIGASSTASVSATGTITGVTANATGSGYVSPTAAIAGGGYGAGCNLTTTVGFPSGSVSGCNVTAGGSGYLAPTVTFSAPPSGTTATGTVTCTAGAVTGITVTNIGSGYGTTVPTVTITDSAGTGAAATAILWNVTWSSPNLYTNQWGTPNPSWTGYGPGFQGGPFYLNPPLTGFLNDGGSTGSWTAMECMTSTPHNLKTGQNITFSRSSGYFSISNGPGSVKTGNSIYPGPSPIYVTGPNSFVVTQVPTNPPTASTGLQMPGGMNNVAGSFPVNYTITIFAPETGAFSGQISHESAAQIVGSFPGCDMWVNIPMAATDGCVQAIARRVRDNLPAGRKVHVEFSNENWNSSFPSNQFTYSMAGAGAWAGAGSANTSYATRASQIHQQFINVFNQADIHGNVNRGGEIVRLFGSAFGQPSVSNNIVTWNNQNGIQMDELCVANYIAAIADVTSPTTAATVSVTGGGATGGTLPAGSYYCYYTWVDGASGTETNVAGSSAQFTIAAGNIPLVTLPTFPTWGSVTANIYLTPTNGLPGTETLFSTGISTLTTTLNAATWSSTQPPSANLMPLVNRAVALLVPNWPRSPAFQATNPWTRAMVLELYRHYINYQSANATYMTSHQQVLSRYTTGSKMPGIIGYEGGLQTLLATTGFTTADPAGYNLAGQLTNDLYYDPAIYDSETAFYVSQQQWGFAKVNVFHFCGGFGSSFAQAIWPACLWSGQSYGKGDGTPASNGTSVQNLFWADTQASHDATNASVRLKGWIDWADAANLYPIPTDLFVTPATGSTGVWTRCVVVVEFNEPMMASSFTTSTFTLRLNGNAVSGVVSYNPTTWAATFTPYGMLGGNENYTAQLTTGVKNAAGTPLATPITWAFSTQANAAGAASRSWFKGLSQQSARPTA